MKKFYIAVTGHRPSKLGNDCYDVNSDLSKKYIDIFKEYMLSQMESNSGYDEYWFISGMALGVDTLWAISALQLQNEGYDKVKLLSAIPCANHDSKWRQSSKKVYNAILKRANKVVHVSDKPYTYQCMQDRNEYMVDNCDKLLAVWDGTSGGTQSCVSYALTKGVTLDRLMPFSNK